MIEFKIDLNNFDKSPTYDEDAVKIALKKYKEKIEKGNALVTNTSYFDSPKDISTIDLQDVVGKITDMEVDNNVISVKMKPLNIGKSIFEEKEFSDYISIRPRIIKSKEMCHVVSFDIFPK